jgi:hypothetical protein
MNEPTTTATLRPELRSQDLVPTVQIVFHDMPKLIFSASEWEAAGGYQGVLKEYALSVRSIKKVERTAMPVHDFALLEDWCG